jgi:HEAT repeat protein
MSNSASIKNQLARLLIAIIVFGVGIAFAAPHISFALASGGNTEARDQDRPADDRDDIRSIALESLFRSEPERASALATDILKSKASTQLKHTAMRLLATRQGASSNSLFLEIARNQSDPELRQAAIHWLSQRPGPEGTQTLIRLYDEQKDQEVRQSILHWLAQRAGGRASEQSQQKEAFDKLLDVAEHDPSLELRQTAIHWLAQARGDRSVDTLISLYDKEKSEELKASILHSLGRRAAAGGSDAAVQKRALAKIFSVAKSDSSSEMRRQAVYFLGTSKDPEAVKFIEDLLK